MLTDRRISLAFLVAWITCTAIYLAVLRGRAANQPGIVGGIIASLLAALAGIAWTGFAMVVHRIVRGNTHRIEPGEWMLFILGTAILLEVTTAVWPKRSFVAPQPVAAALVCLATAIPTFSRSMSPSWKCLLGLLVLLQSVVLILSATNANQIASVPTVILMSLFRLRQSLAIVGPLLVTVWQVRLGTRFSPLHWIGVAVYSLWMGISLAVG
jgi:hypothetical protein